MAPTIDDPRQRELFEMNWLCHRPLAGKSKDGPKYGDEQDKPESRRTSPDQSVAHR